MLTRWSNFDRNFQLLDDFRRQVDRLFGEGSFRRAFQLPSGVNLANVAAELKNGVVSIRLPKSEAIKPRRIEIQTA